ncbi:MAG: 30S ribosomal protein S20 [Lachnospiraceae bacterium]|nr:30S ribosomal protein S20 [Lachnospiraceae bacterium]
MANIKSAKKRVITSAKRAERNKSRKSAVKTSIKKVYAAIDANDKAAAAEALKAAIGEMEKAGSKGLFHRGTVSRKVSRLTKAVNRIG